MQDASCVVGGGHERVNKRVDLGVFARDAARFFWLVLDLELLLRLRAIVAIVDALLLPGAVPQIHGRWVDDLRRYARYGSAVLARLCAVFL